MLKLSWLAVAILMLSGAALYAEDKKEEHHHDEAGPNGGELQDVGDTGGHHVEVKHDHTNGKTNFWVIAKDAKTAVALSTKEAPKINLKTKDGNKKIDMKPVNEKDGKATQWEAADEGFKQDPIDGRIQFKLEDGKTYNVKLDPHFGKEHKH
jgi:hypothetical protein